jgi:putative ABC transport system ATP-binding protein
VRQATAKAATASSSAPKAMGPVVVAHKITKRRRKGLIGFRTEQTILSDTSIDLRPGELICIGGDSGSGKSTLLRILALVDEPTAGKLIIAGHDIRVVNRVERDGIRAEHLHYIPQGHLGLLPRAALQNVAHWLMRFDGLSREQAKAAAKDALRFAGLPEDKFDQRVDRGMSGGEKARVAIAVALARRRQICLADEPFAALDRKRAEEITCLFRAVANRGAAVALIVHEPLLSALASHFDRVLVLERGRIKEELVNDAPSPCPEPLFPASMARARPQRAPSGTRLAWQWWLAAVVLLLVGLGWLVQAQLPTAVDPAGDHPPAVPRLTGDAPLTNLVSVPLGTAESWVGGWYRGDGKWYGRPWVSLYGADTSYAQASLSFVLDGTPTEATLALTGLDDEEPGATTIAIEVNGIQIYSGPDPFLSGAGPRPEVSADWTTERFAIPAGIMNAGDNRITVENLDPGAQFSAPPYVLLSDAALEMHPS